MQELGHKDAMSSPTGDCWALWTNKLFWREETAGKTPINTFH